MMYKRRGREELGENVFRIFILGAIFLYDYVHASLFLYHALCVETTCTATICLGIVLTCDDHGLLDFQVTLHPTWVLLWMN